MSGSTSSSDSSNNSNSTWGQNVWDQQGDALKGMYDQMGGLWDDQGKYTGKMDEMAGDLGGYMQNIMGGAMGGYNNMMGGGSVGDTTDIRNMLMGNMRNQGSNVGDMYKSIVGGEGNTYIDPMVNAMKSSSMDNLKRMQSNTGMNAAAMGQGGSSRHAMQNAMQSKEMNQDMLNREMQLRGGGYDKDLQMKMGIAEQADQGNQMNNDRLMKMMGMSDSNTGFGMNQGQGMQNLGMGSMAPWQQASQSPWNAAGNWANILGNPTVLGSGTGDSSGNASSKGTGLGAKG